MWNQSSCTSGPEALPEPGMPPLRQDLRAQADPFWGRPTEVCVFYFLTTHSQTFSLEKLEEA